MSDLASTLGRDMTRHPKHIVIVLACMICCSITYPSMLFGALLSLLLPRNPRISGVFCVVSAITVLGVIGFDGRSLIGLGNDNFYYLLSLVVDRTFFVQDYTWIALMIFMSLFLANVIILIREMGRGLHGELKQVAQGRFEGKQYLSSKACRRALARVKTASVPQGACLGINRQTGRPVHLLDAQANCHTLAIGTTGSGKTTAISHIIESAIRRKLPVIIVDGKGDLLLARQVMRFAERHHLNHYLFSMMGESVKYNPLSGGGITSKKDRIIALRDWSEDHYRKIAESYLQRVFHLLTEANQPVDLVTLGRYLDPKILAPLIQPLGNPNLYDHVRQLMQHEKDISSVKAELDILTQSEIGHLFDCSSGEVLCLEQALNEPAVVYFCLQPLAFPSYASCLGKLIINDIKQLAANQLDQEQKQVIYTIFDEFSLFSGEQIIHLINQGRSAGIHAVLATQSLSDLKSDHEGFLGQILNNCNNYIIQRQNNPEDADVLANIIGTQDTYQITSQISTNPHPDVMGSVRPVKEYLVHPDEIKRLRRGEAIFINKLEFLIQHVVFNQSRI